jgi:hypothetical protein
MAGSGRGGGMTAVDVAIIVLASLSLVRVLTRTWTR